MLLCGFKTRLGFESSGFSMWHFLKLVARGFLRVLQFSSLLHRLMVQPINKAKINAIYTLSNLIAELSLCTTWHVTLHVACGKCSMCCMRFAHDCKPLERTCWRQFTAQWGDCKKSLIGHLNAIIVTIIITTDAMIWHTASHWRQKNYHVGQMQADFLFLVSTWERLPSESQADRTILRQWCPNIQKAHPLLPNIKKRTAHNRTGEIGKQTEQESNRILLLLLHSKLDLWDSPLLVRCLRM